MIARGNSPHNVASVTSPVRLLPSNIIGRMIARFPWLLGWFPLLGIQPGGIQGPPSCHRYDFLVHLWNRLNFFELFKLLFSLGIDHDPLCSLCSHDLCLFLFLMFHSSHDHMAKRSHYCIMIFYMTLEYYSMDASSPSFSPSTSSTNPPPLYSPSMSINNGPTWRRIPPGRAVWSKGRSLEY